MTITHRPPSKAVHRLTFRVPLIDTSVKGWWDAQLDPSVSLRALIRDEIERNGISDTQSRPVTQQPRRGRPPAATADVDTAPAEPSRRPTQPTTEPQTASAAPAPQLPETTPHGEVSATGHQFDMDAMFGQRN